MPCGAFDVLVLGGGPAGNAAALALRRAGRSVAVLERSHYDNERVGETLAPEVGPALARLGVLDVMATVPGRTSPGVVSLWGGDEAGETDFLFNPYGPGRHVDRSRFDAALADCAASAGATVVRGAVPASAEPIAGGWVVTAEVKCSPVRFVARWLLDATGRAAWLARRRGATPVRADRLVAVVARVGGTAGPDDRLAIEARPDGWWYVAPLPGDAAVAAFLTDSDLLPSGEWLRPFWERQRASARMVGARFRGPAAGGRLRVVPASAGWAGTAAGTGWLTIGDAAVVYDPLSGAGVWKSLHSGMRAAEALLAAKDDNPGALVGYGAACQAEYHSHLIARSRVYAAVDDWPEHPFWQRRLAAPNVTDPSRGGTW
jgi:flavin-dependent dehydrogenase